MKIQINFVSCAPQSKPNSPNKTLYDLQRFVIESRRYTTNFAPVFETTIDVIRLAKAA